MKLTIKTLDQKTFHVEFDDARTVWDLKTHLCALPEVGVQPDQQQIIYAGRVLENGSLLRAYSIDERRFLVVMAKKTQLAQSQPAAAAEAAAKSKAPDQAGPSTTRKSDLQQQSDKATPKTAITVPKPTIQGTASATATAAAAVAPLLAGSASDELVHNIMDMGYAESDVRRALLASFNNPDRAIEYLIDGIPDLPDIFEQPSEMIADNPLGFLRTDPRFNQMRRILQQRPELLNTVLAKIGETNPALLTIIRDHQDEFVRMLNDSGAEPSLGTGAGAGAAVDPSLLLNRGGESAAQLGQVVLTANERSAVERLVALGFPFNMVVQAYMACEKNEEETADFLCRHLDDN